MTHTLVRTSLDEGSARRRDLYLTTYNTQQTEIHSTCGIRTPNRNKRATADPHLRPRSHRDWIRVLSCIIPYFLPPTRCRLLTEQHARVLVAVFGVRIVWVRAKAHWMARNCREICARLPYLYSRLWIPLHRLCWRCLWFAELWKCHSIVWFCRSSCKLRLQKTSEVWNWVNVCHYNKFTDVTCYSELCRFSSKLLNLRCLSEDQVMEILTKEFLFLGSGTCMLLNSIRLMNSYQLCCDFNVTESGRRLKKIEFRHLQVYYSRIIIGTVIKYKTRWAR